MKVKSFIPLILAAVIVSAFLIGREAARKNAMADAAGAPVFVLDPGHGGEDGGAVSADGTKESAINLSVALRTDSLLGLLGHPCILTRSEETLAYPPEAKTVRQRKQADLDRRVAQVNAVPCAVLVSIHQNKYPTSGPRGAQVFYRDEPRSIAFAGILETCLTAGTGPYIRPASAISDSIYLMRKAECPGVHLECGFLSNPEELKLLCSAEYQTRLALCLACACEVYAEEWEDHNGQGSQG